MGPGAGEQAAGRAEDEFVIVEPEKAATALWAATGDSALVQRWGRWQSGKSMETYLQELQAATMMADLRPEVRERVVMRDASPTSS